jgi:23S rRNA (pseudouridine1915-N3)-methyltransferase
MKITVIAVGKLKERYFQDACDEYIKRIGRYADLTVIEERDGFDKQKEGERVLRRLARFASVNAVALAAKGEAVTSEGLAELLRLSAEGAKQTVFIIGGAEGLSDEVYGACGMKLSFSKMTFPHRLFRVMLLEQIYRAGTILRNEPYHRG